MKTAVLIAPQQFALREMPEPEAPPGGLVLQVAACGICGSDLRRWKEGPPAGTRGVVPGHEVAGTVVAVGKNTSRFAPGDRLAIAPDVHCGTCYYCQRGRFNLCDHLQFLGITAGFPGGFAEKMILTSKILTNGIVHPVPAELSLTHAALAEPCCSVLSAHNQAGTTLGDTVVIQGAGPIGCIHVAVAKSRGARVIISEPSQVRRELARSFQPDLIVDPVNENLNQSVRDFTNGIGADIVICANPVAATQAQAVEIVRKAGKVILFGGLPKANPMTTLDGNRIHYSEIQVIGSFSYHPTMHELALELLKRQVIQADLLITDSFNLDDIQKGYQRAASGSALKVIIKP